MRAHTWNSSTQKTKASMKYIVISRWAWATGKLFQNKKGKREKRKSSRHKHLNVNLCKHSPLADSEVHYSPRFSTSNVLQWWLSIYTSYTSPTCSVELPPTGTLETVLIDRKKKKPNDRNLSLEIFHLPKFQCPSSTTMEIHSLKPTAN